MKKLGFIFAALSLASTSMAQERGLSIEDLVTMERVGEPVIAPDGKKLVYAVRKTDLEKNKGKQDLYTLDLTQNNPQPNALTVNGGHSPQWSSRGDAIYFLSNQSGKSQVWKIPSRGGEALQVTNFPIDVENFKVSPTGEKIVVALEVFPDCASISCTHEREEKIKKSKTSARTYDRLFVRHWDVWADGKRSGLFSASFDSEGKVVGEPTSLSVALDGDAPSKPHGGIDEYNFSPDGRQLVFSLRVAGKTEAWSTNFDVYQVPVDGSSAPKNLTAENLAWDTKAQYSPDGKSLAYLAMQRPGFEADRFQLTLLDLQTGAKREIATTWDRSIESYRWSKDGKTIYALADDVGQHRLFAIDLQSSQVKALTNQGAVTAFDLHGDDLVVSYNSLQRDAQLYRFKLSTANAIDVTDTKKAQQLTQNNKALFSSIKLGEYEQFHFEGANGETVYGHVMKPWNAKPGDKYPIAFIVHGGPQGSFGNKWGYRWNPQIYAGAGYAVVFIDFHGSTGYGQAFTDSISGDWGGKPLEDLKKGLAAAGQKYSWLDTTRSCALGASYGGYMMNWIAGNWSDGFKCIVSHAGVFDTRGMYYASEEIWFNEWENGGPYFNAPANYEKFNPSRLVKNWKTPMLVIQGELDFRIPTEQALGTFTALQRQGIDSKLIVFPDENHWVTKPGNSIYWHHQVLDWLKKHMSQ